MSNYPKNWDKIRKAIYQRDNYTCQECGATDTELHCHHITPISKGGGHDPQNLKTLCKSCHEDVHGHAIGGGEKKSTVSLLEWSFLCSLCIVISIAFPPAAIIGIPALLYCLIKLTGEV